MDKKIKKEWVAALRSGKYKQTQGYLCADGGFCCLGVLCDIAIDADWELVSSNYDDETVEAPEAAVAYEIEDCMYGLPDILTEKIGAEANVDFTHILPNMNDAGSSFSEIADYIEENL